MVRLLKIFNQIYEQLFSRKTKQQKGVGLYIGAESFSLCVIDNIAEIEETTRCYSARFPATIKSYATDFFTDKSSAKYIFDFIKQFVPQKTEDINLILPDNIANIAVTPVHFATDIQARGYTQFQSSEIFNRHLTEPIFSVCRIERYVSKSPKEQKSKYLVACAEMANMIMLKECANANNIDLITAEPVALCALRAFTNISQGNVLFVFASLTLLFFVTLHNGRTENFYAPAFDAEKEGFIEKFSETIISVAENFHPEHDTLKIKLAGDDIKYKICETLEKLNVAKEVSLAKCKLDLTSLEDVLSFGAALRNS
ncbi:MAG: hypothetical protein Q4C78_05390 [Synergistaceae bacterium]|nr:hypothetical protein [Synergistaceae bacterium]